MPKILRTDKFVEEFLHLDSKEKKQVIKTLQLLESNPRHPSLQVHRIKGTALWEAYANKDIRVIYEQTGDTLLLLVCGHHDLLKRY
ncbi:DNA helicase [Desulforamulus ruminis]|uniref:DNA helicase n=1 Tax=Desulforamulus ruminis (strain ATCC 23193 / DSM 2154 / NCIMB 8452 / DL) TaxID=696281 RepID=F6DQ37_DESRL|nr:hypothetical protein [Desulforamulus ruminis]AEG61981.1 hypothetical protein Desru_3781 [Desulforamulus ruminis DSM 2154]